MEPVLAVIHVIFSLGLVIILCWLSIRILLPRLLPGNAGRQAHLQIVERLPVGLRSYLCLVRLGEHVFLLGVSAAQITLLAEIPSGSISSGTENVNCRPLSDFPAILRHSREQASRSLHSLKEKYGRPQTTNGERREKDEI
jgi:flagellar biosynthetic protein FliO